MDAWLLWLEGRLLRQRSRWYRLAGAAALGAFAACLEVLLSDWLTGRSVVFLIFSVVGALLMQTLAFGGKSRRDFCRRLLVFGGLSFFFGGVGALLEGWLNDSGFFGQFFLSLLLGGILLAAVEERRERKNLCRVRLVWRGSSICLTGLRDTGNTLMTPEGRRPVHVVSADSVRDWSRQSMENILWIPFRSVGEEGSVLPAIQIDELWIDETVCRPGPVIAFSRYPVSSDGRYQILLHSQEALP